MAAAAAEVTTAFAELQRQQELMASCTRLYKQLTDHFTDLENTIVAKSELLRTKRRLLETRAARSLDSLRRRDASIESSVDAAISALPSLKTDAVTVASLPTADDIAANLKALCVKMDSAGFLEYIVNNRKEVEVLRAEIPVSLTSCIDPASFVMDAVAEIFPVDKREVKSPNDLSWVCVLVLEGVVAALADPEIGVERMLVPRAAKERAREMAEAWKEGFERRGGVEGARPPDAHAFLQLVATFGIGSKEDKWLYRKLIVSFSWRRQMPRLGMSLGLEEEMADIIEELIAKGQQLDAVSFAYEAGLQDKFPPVPLLKSFLEDSKKTTTSSSSSSSSSESQSSGQAGNNANKKEQSALRAVIKCIEDRKLESEFPIESLQKQLEELEKAKTEKKKAMASTASSGPANKRTRANNGAPMPPAKAGRLTNNAYVSSFPATATTFVQPLVSHTSYPAPSPYPYDRPAGHGLYGSRSPVAIREPCVYPAEEVVNVGLGISYPPTVSYPTYGGYNNSFGSYNNGLAPAFHQPYYR